MNKSRILFLAANPAGSQLQLDVESKAIEQRIRATDFRDSLELVTKWAVSPDDLLEYLNEYRPHVVHFSGHGTEEEQIILVDASLRAIPVSSAALKQLFTTLKDNIDGSCCATAASTAQPTTGCSSRCASGSSRSSAAATVSPRSSTSRTPRRRPCSPSNSTEQASTTSSTTNQPPFREWLPVVADALGAEPPVTSLAGWPGSSPREAAVMMGTERTRTSNAKAKAELGSTRATPAGDRASVASPLRPDHLDRWNGTSR